MDGIPLSALTAASKLFSADIYLARRPAHPPFRYPLGQRRSNDGAEAKKATEGMSLPIVPIARGGEQCQTTRPQAPRRLPTGPRPSRSAVPSQTQAQNHSG